MASIMFSAFGALVDTDNNAATNAMFLGDIDMSKGTLLDLCLFIAPNYSDVSNDVSYLMKDAPYLPLNSAITTNSVKDIVTNTVVVGYTEWAYAGDTSPSASYSIMVTESGNDYVFSLYDPSLVGSVTTNELNPTILTFQVTGGSIIASRSPKLRNALGLAQYSDVQALDDKLENMDTSYYRVVGITNKNQSVQYVYTDSNVTELKIQMPSSGMTKDWLVYVLAVTNVTLKLPAANYWCVSEAVTNDIQSYTPTALYFSQINDDTYSIGRQELIPITVETQRARDDREILKKIKKRNTTLRVSGSLKK